MSRFFKGQRVIERISGHVGTVLQYVAKESVAVEFDPFFGGEGGTYSVGSEELIALTNNNTCLLVHEEEGAPLVAIFRVGEHIEPHQIIATFNYALTAYKVGECPDPIVRFASDKVCKRFNACVDFFEVASVVSIPQTLTAMKGAPPCK